MYVSDAVSRSLRIPIARSITCFFVKVAAALQIGAFLFFGLCHRLLQTGRHRFAGTGARAAWYSQLKRGCQQHTVTARY